MKSLAVEVLGVARLDEANAIQEAYTHLSGTTLQAREFEAERTRLDSYNRGSWDTIPPDEQERLTTLDILRQIFDERTIRYSNVLQQWPSYEAAYNNLEGSISIQGLRWALQVGCLTPVSSAAFSALSREVYSAEPLTIDLTSFQARGAHSSYAVTDALALGIAGNSIHIAQTNGLLNMLQARKEPVADSPVPGVFSEIYRVLQPGGHVLSYELTPRLDFTEHPWYESPKSRERIATFKKDLSVHLARIGFTSIVVAPATVVEGVDYLFDSTRNFSTYKTRNQPGKFMVSARKPEV